MHPNHIAYVVQGVKSISMHDDQQPTHHLRVCSIKFAAVQITATLHCSRHGVFGCVCVASRWVMEGRGGGT